MDKQATQTTKGTSEPWSKQIPYLTKGFDRAEQLYNSPKPQFFPGSTVQSFSPNQQQAQQRGIDRSMNGNAAMNASQAYAQKSINGDFLNSYDKDGSVFNNVASKVMPAVGSQFMAAGRSGSGLHQDNAIRSMTEAYAPMAAQGYAQERGMQQDMAQYAPQYAANDYMDIAAQDAVGTQEQGLAQRERDDAVARWSYNQDLPYNSLQQYMGLIGGNWGGTTTSQQPYTQPGMLSTLGGLGMMGLGSYLGGG